MKMQITDNITGEVTIIDVPDEVNENLNNNFAI